MTAKTARERFDGAIAELKKLEGEGYDCGPVRRLSLSATGKVKEPEPKAEKPKAEAAKPFSSFGKDEVKS